jgi:hypothetical protein
MLTFRRIYGIINVIESGKKAKKVCILEWKQMYKDESQLKFEDFVFPYGKLNCNNEWVQLSRLIPWDKIEKRYAKKFVNNGLRISDVSGQHFRRHPDSVSIASGQHIGIIRTAYRNYPDSKTAHPDTLLS